MIFIDRHRGTLQWLRVPSAGGSADNTAMALYNAFAFYVIKLFLLFDVCVLQRTFNLAKKKKKPKS